MPLGPILNKTDAPYVEPYHSRPGRNIFRLLSRLEIGQADAL